MKEYDFSKVTSSSNKTFEPIEEGRYTLEILDITKKLTDSGNELLNVKFKITTPGKYAGRYVWRTFTLTERALPFLKELLESTNSDCANKGCTSDMIIQSLLTKKVSAWITPGTTINGNLKHDVTKFVSLDDLDKDQLADVSENEETTEDSPIFQ